MRRVGFAVQAPEGKATAGLSMKNLLSSWWDTAGSHSLYSVCCAVGKSASLCRSQTIGTEANQASALLSNSSNAS